jgi:signal transduction histidine kinase/FixJ family two-component response regulator
MPNERILVLEDDESIRLETGRTLAGAGYRVQTAATAEQALALTRGQKFDLLLADVYLPDSDGIRVFHRIRERQPELAGIAMTGHSSWDLAMDAIRVGFAGLLVKPFPVEQLISAVVGALEQEGLRRENARLRALVPLYELSRTFMGPLELGQVLEHVLVIAREETGADMASLMLVDEESQDLSIAVAEGLPREIVETQRQALGTHIAGYVAQQGEALIIAEDLPLPREVLAAMGKPEIGSALCLPLTVRGQVIGVLNLSRRRGSVAFTQSDLELATVLASQAAVAIDQARLIQVLREMSETSQRLAGALDLDDAATTILEAAVRITGGSRAALWLIEELTGQLSLYKTNGFSEDDALRLKPPPFVSADDGGPGRESQNEGIVCMPMLRGDRKFGLIEIHLSNPHRLRPDRLGALRTLAHAASAVVESHRLRAREFIAFREIDSTVRVESSIQQALERLIRQMAEACNAQSGAIFIREARSDRANAWVELARGAPDEYAREAMIANRPLLKQSVGDLRRGIGSVVAAPLTIGSRVEGAVVLTHSAPRAFGQRHLNLLSVLASSAALIVRNAQLYAWSEEKVITEERARMAREIHDGLAQDINFMLMRAQLLQELMRRGKEIQLEAELDTLVKTLRRDLREVRQTIFALRPVEIETLGFVPALKKFIMDFGTANDLKMHLDMEGEAGHLAPKTQSALYRLAQETMNNIRKHARAENVRVILRFDSAWAQLEVADDGQGFELESALEEANKRGSVGLVQMRERAERAGGTFDVESAPDEGTRVRVRLPIR